MKKFELQLTIDFEPTENTSLLPITCWKIWCFWNGVRLFLNASWRYWHPFLSMINFDISPLSRTLASGILARMFPVASRAHIGIVVAVDLLDGFELIDEVDLNNVKHGERIVKPDSPRQFCFSFVREGVAIEVVSFDRTFDSSGAERSSGRVFFRATTRRVACVRRQERRCSAARKRSEWVWLEFVLK